MLSMHISSVGIGNQKENKNKKSRIAELIISNEYVCVKAFAVLILLCFF